MNLLGDQREWKWSVSRAASETLGHCWKPEPGERPGIDDTFGRFFNVLGATFSGPINHRFARTGIS